MIASSMEEFMSKSIRGTQDKQRTIFELSLLALFTLIFALYILFPEIKLVDYSLSGNLTFTLTIKELIITFLLTFVMIFAQMGALKIIEGEKRSIPINSHLTKVILISGIIVVVYSLLKFLLGYLLIVLLFYIFGYEFSLVPMIMNDKPNEELSGLLIESRNRMKSNKFRLLKMDFGRFILGLLLGIIVFYIVGRGNTDGLMVLVLAMISIQIPNLLLNRATIYQLTE